MHGNIDLAPARRSAIVARLARALHAQRLAALAPAVVLITLLLSLGPLTSPTLLEFFSPAELALAWLEHVLELAVIAALLLAAFVVLDEWLPRGMPLRLAGSEQQLALLQAQIEPHFLFNVLGNVRRLYRTQPASGRGSDQQPDALPAHRPAAVAQPAHDARRRTGPRTRVSRPLSPAHGRAAQFLDRRRAGARRCRVPADAARHAGGERPRARHRSGGRRPCRGARAGSAICSK